MSTENVTRKTSNPLNKQHSWSHDEAWTNRRINNRLRRSRTVTYDDLEELRACLDLGFGFESPNLNPNLFSTFPALDMYLNTQLHDTMFRSNSDCFSDLDSVATSCSIVDPGEDSETVKTRLKEWAQVVASSLRHLSVNKIR